jgi:hypothetical protein
MIRVKVLITVKNFGSGIAVMHIESKDEIPSRAMELMMNTIGPVVGEMELQIKILEESVAEKKTIKEALSEVTDIFGELRKDLREREASKDESYKFN